MTIHRLLAFLLAIVLFPAAAGAVTIIDNHTVNTSAATGTFTPPPGFGPLTPLVAVGSSLSVELAGLIDDTHPQFASAPFHGMILPFGTQTNFDFLTNPTVFGNAGQQLFDDMTDVLLADLAAAYPTTLFSMASDGSVFTGRSSYSLLGGTIPGPGPGDTTVVTGVANVDFFEINMQVSATPAAALAEPGTVWLFGLGLAVLAATKRYLGEAGQVQGTLVPVYSFLSFRSYLPQRIHS